MGRRGTHSAQWFSVDRTLGAERGGAGGVGDPCWPELGRCSGRLQGAGEARASLKMEEASAQG